MIESVAENKPVEKPKWKPLPVEDMRRRIGIDPETGVMTWLDGHYAGNAVGVQKHRKSDGGVYGRMTFRGVDYAAHRVAWVLYHGEAPSGSIDHRDGDGLNNAKGNLRIATVTENNRNHRVVNKTLSGVKGVSWARSFQRWYAQIKVDGKRFNLGRYMRIEDAWAAYRAASLKYHGEFGQFDGDLTEEMILSAYRRAGVCRKCCVEHGEAEECVRFTATGRRGRGTIAVVRRG